MQVEEQQKVNDVGCGNGSFLALVAYFCNPKK